MGCRCRMSLNSHVWEVCWYIQTRGYRVVIQKSYSLLIVTEEGPSSLPISWRCPCGDSAAWKKFNTSLNTQSFILDRWKLILTVALQTNEGEFAMIQTCLKALNFHFVTLGNIVKVTISVIFN